MLENMGFGWIKLRLQLTITCVMPTRSSGTIIWAGVDRKTECLNVGYEEE